MGITYFALPVPAPLVNIARINPRAFLPVLPAGHAWPNPPDALLLDKPWRDLRDLLGMPRDKPPRPAFELLRGEVKEYGYGWLPYERVLGPQDIAGVARDLARLDLAAMYQAYSSLVSPDWAAIMDGRRCTVESYARKARVFTARLAERGQGLVYSIG
ncbi:MULTISPECIES: hypothetical protein [unclassified Arthrobacter]|uniref:hypothetical protein n=1 Tax=unclassified Arthrobacter TaxID=235627 RepID=UPI00159E0EC9|nr:MULTISPECIES: hypothetical protein [unclassified Arthrobacter]MCQ9165956.1 hypothetical protein [Arthrobacter sp. STN4]NVM99704.1 hypothetical protein [Arthrobacter sp. SDTb3-6]